MTTPPRTPTAAPSDAGLVERVARSMMRTVFHEIDVDKASLDWTGNDVWGCDFEEMAEAAIPIAQAPLQRFKEYVHKRLDDAGIPVNPDGEHSKHGCRIGDRLDIALAAQQEIERLRDTITNAAYICAHSPIDSYKGGATQKIANIQCILEQALTETKGA